MKCPSLGDLLCRSSKHTCTFIFSSIRVYRFMLKKIISFGIKSKISLNFLPLQLDLGNIFNTDRKLETVY